MDVTIKIDPQQLKQLYIEAAHIEDAIPRHLRAAVNMVSKTVRVQIGKRLGQVMHLKNNYPPKEIKKADTLKKSIKAKSMASLEKAEARLGFDGGYPFPLKYFDAKPIFRKKKGKKVYKGVQFKAEKGFIRRLQGQPDRLSQDVYFMLPSRGHHVFRRTGKTATPIIRMNGPAPGDYYQQIQAIPLAKQIATERLPVEIKRRIRAILLEKKGLINLKASRGA